MTAPREPHRPPSPPDRRPSPRGGHPSSQTASAAARPAGFARLAGARRGLVHSVRALAAAALLALFGGLALPATAQAQGGICARAQQVRDAIVGLIPSVSNCADVTATHLAGINSPLFLSGGGLTALKAGDFDGLTALTVLFLGDNDLTELPAGVFDGLIALETLQLKDNSLTELPPRVFDNNTALRTLELGNNGLISLPAGVFEKLIALEMLELGHNGLISLRARVPVTTVRRADKR